MSDRFHPLSLDHLTAWIADELDSKRLNIRHPPRARFHAFNRRSLPHGGFRAATGESDRGCCRPHSQLAQNICSRGCAAPDSSNSRPFRPSTTSRSPSRASTCRTKATTSSGRRSSRSGSPLREYLHAWVLIHALHRRFGFPGDVPGVIFNLSVGYNLEGIRQPNMQQFLDQDGGRRRRFTSCLEIVAQRFPEFADIEVPPRLSDNVTLSTMHGCPPDEIGAISDYLLRERRLHTSVKLNPTLLGAGTGPGDPQSTPSDSPTIEVPDEAFAHDLVLDDGLSLIEGLQTTAGRPSSISESSSPTLWRSATTAACFSTSEETMYLSGRPLHALTVTLAHVLADALVQQPPIMSFSGGADAANTPTLLRCGMRTVTVVLGPPQTRRLSAVRTVPRKSRGLDGGSPGAGSSMTFIRSGSPDGTYRGDRCRRRISASTPGGHHCSDHVPCTDFQRNNTKTARTPGSVRLHQGAVHRCLRRRPKRARIYAAVRDGDVEGAASDHPGGQPSRVDPRADLPPPVRTGVPAHPHGSTAGDPRDQTVHHRPRDIRRGGSARPVEGAAGGGCRRRARAVSPPPPSSPGPAGPSPSSRRGLQAGAWSQRPFQTTVQPITPSNAISNGSAGLGVEHRFGQDVGSSVSLASLRDEGFAAIVVAVGARRGRPLGLDNETAQGVIDGLDFLRSARTGQAPDLGRRIGIIGGGDVAMDCARTACRLSDGEVTVFYRRTRARCPPRKRSSATFSTRAAASSSSRRRKSSGRQTGGSTGSKCGRCAWKARPSGRRRPESDSGGGVRSRARRPDRRHRPTPRSQGLRRRGCGFSTASGFLDVDPLTLETSLHGVYAGGDIIGGGPANIVKAAGDGRKIADAILAREERATTDDPTT